MRRKINIGDLVYHEFSEEWGWVADMNDDPLKIVSGADTLIEWANGGTTWNFRSNAIRWKQFADREKKKLDKRGKVK